MATMTTKKKRGIEEKSSLHKLTRMNESKFDILDDHHDPMEHRAEDLNRYFTSPSLRSITMKAEEEEELMMVTGAMADDTSGSEVEEMDDGHEEEEEEEEEQHLSQQMTELSVKSTKRQLSGSSTPTATTAKKMKVSDPSDMDETYDDQIIIDEHEKDEQIPNYLLPTSVHFEQQMKQVLARYTSVPIDDLRQVATIKYQGSRLEQRKRLLLVYLRAGNGTLIERGSEGSININVRYWPSAVTSMVEQTEHRLCERAVQERIQMIDDRLGQCQQQLEAVKQRCPVLTTKVEEAIDEIVDYAGLKHLRTKYDAQIALIECDYRAEMLDRQYLQKRPNPFQAETAHRLYALQFEHEKARRIVMEWKQCFPASNSERIAGGHAIEGQCHGSLVIDFSQSAGTVDSTGDDRLYGRACRQC